MRLAGVLPEGFLRALPEQERKKLGRAGITAAEASATFKRGKELELQKLCMNWLLLHDIYLEYDWPDKRTSGKKRPGGFPYLLQREVDFVRVQGGRRKAFV